MSPNGHIEEAATVVVGLRRIADVRAARVAHLAALVADSLPPSRSADRSPRDAFGRLCEALDGIVDLEAQALAVIDDLRAGMYSRAKVGSPARPVGYSPGQAAVALQAMALARAGYLAAMSAAVHALCQTTPTRPRRLSPAQGSALRGELRAMAGTEEHARRDGLTLIGLVIPPVLAEAG